LEERRESWSAVSMTLCADREPLEALDGDFMVGKKNRMDFFPCSLALLRLYEFYRCV
jgi:hypothetical protein